MGEELLEELRRSSDPGYPRWGDRHQNYTYPDPETPEQYAHNCLLSRIAGQKGVERFEGHEVELAEGKARVAVDAVRLWNRVNQVVPCMLQANLDEKVAMAMVQQFECKVAQPVAPATLFEAAVPSFQTVSWKTVLKLRGNKSFSALRQKMAEAVERAGESIDTAKKALVDFEQEAMETIVDAARPRPRKVAIESILSNLPLPGPVNPVGAYFNVRDTAKAINRERKFGWLYLLRDIRAATKE